MKKKKKIFIILIVIVLVVAIAIGIVIKKRDVKEENESLAYTRTVTLSYSKLQETIVSSGTIESQNTSTVTANTNAQVAKINYGIGDYVNEGDVIIELDKTSISKQISKIENNISDQVDTLQNNYDNAVISKDEIWNTWSDTSNSLKTATSAYNEASIKVAGYQSIYNTAYGNYQTAVEKLLTDGCVISSQTNNVSNCVGFDNDIETFSNAVSALKEAENNLNTIKSVTNYESLKKEYESLLTSYNNLTNQLSNANSKVSDTKDALDEGVNNDTLNDLYDSLDDYKLTAKTSGQITSMNAVVGSNPNGSLATIQDTSKLKISLTIDEYDIFKVELGQKALIETDASDIVYEGVVSQISPVASGGMGSSGFEVEVEVTSEDVSKLLIGMSSEVTIIVDQLEENFSVPTDAVETRDDGTSAIYVQDENGDFYEVYVTLGNTSGYYVEIFGDELKEGMKVRASADPEEAKVNISSEISEDDFSNFSFGNFGGNMPSGGFSGDMPSGGFSGNMPSGGTGSGNMPSRG